MNKYDVLKVLGDDFDSGSTMRELMAATAMGACGTLTAMTIGKSADAHSDTLINALIMSVAALISAQSVPTAFAPLLNGPMNDLAELAQEVLNSLKFGAKVSESTLLFLTSEICDELGIDLEGRLSELVKAARAQGMYYPPQEPGEPDAEQGAP